MKKIIPKVNPNDREECLKYTGMTEKRTKPSCS